MMVAATKMMIFRMSFETRERDRTKAIPSAIISTSPGFSPAKNRRVSGGRSLNRSASILATIRHDHRGFVARIVLNLARINEAYGA